jgi:glycerate 2-kinase
MSVGPSRVRDATLDDLRATLRGAFEAALGDLDPARLVKEALPPLPPKRAKVRIVAAGKAAAAMTRGAFDLWGDRIADALVVSTHAEAATTPRTVARVAAHPIPDARSRAAAEDALARARSLNAPDVLLALISGGASALLSLAPESIGLEGKAKLVATLLEAGAPIREVNLVRRHLSQIKGGGLALAAAPARTLTLIVSDVIGGLAHDVGSGPSVPDPTLDADAERVVRRYAPSLLPLPFATNLRPETPGIRTRAMIIAGPQTLAEAVVRRLGKVGFDARTEPADEGDARDVAARRIALAKTLAPGEAVVIATEPTLALAATRGSGGRAGYVALAALHGLPADVALLSAASDGADGSSGTAGALVIGSDAARISPERARAALAAFDDGAAHRELGTALAPPTTRHNLADIHVVARAR